MMKQSYILFSTLVLLFCMVSPAIADGRGTWVVRFDIDTPEKVHQMCSPENQRQFDRYLVQVRGRADSWYDSDFVPKAEGLDFDPLALILKECTEVDIHAWINVYYLWTGDVPPADPNHPYYHNDWILKDRTGRLVKSYSALEQRQHWIEGVYADPASADYRDYFKDVVAELIEKYNVAGVHLDFVRYPGAFFGGEGVPRLSRLTRQDFAALENGSGDPAIRARLANRLSFDLCRAENVTRMVRGVKEVVDRVNPEVRLSASVFPDLTEALLDKGQYWSTWLREGLLDDLYVMTYFGESARVQSQLAACKKICDLYNVQLWAGLGAYIKTAQEIRLEIAGAESLGITDMCLFSLGHLLKQRRDVGAYLAQNREDVVISEPPSRQLSQLVKLVVAGHFPRKERETIETNLPSAPTLRLRGIFRYVDHHDEYAKVAAQYKIMAEVQVKLQAGESFKSLSTEYSQAGTKHQGGVLPSLHFSDAKDQNLQSLFDLQVGGYSEIIAVHNGFWIYQVLGASF